MNEIGNAFGLLSVGFGLLMFGAAYNVLVSWLEQHGYDEGYTALLVVGGVLITLAGVALLDWVAAVRGLFAFACSGTPMVLGSWWRHVQARRRAQDELRDAQ